MTIKWGDPIECNGVRPDWLREGERVRDIDPGCATNGIDRAAKHWNWARIKAFCVRSDHPAYVALARGFHPWSGGESAPDDWDGGVLFRDGHDAVGMAGWSWGRGDTAHPREIIGYRKRVEYGAVDTDGSRSGDTVEVRRMTEAEATEFANKAAFDGLGHTAPCYAASGAHACLKALGLIRPESRAERFTRETGHAVTEAVEAALNWKGE